MDDTKTVTATFDAPPSPTRSLTLVNYKSTDEHLTEIVQVKVAATLEGVYTRDDLLVDDPAECVSFSGNYIGPGGHQEFPITVGNDYYVFIGIGQWEPIFEPPYFCPTSSAWVKLRYFTSMDSYMYYVYTVVRVTGHTGGNNVWTISGSYTEGTLVVTPQGGNPILFAVGGNPIP